MAGEFVIPPPTVYISGLFCGLCVCLAQCLFPLDPLRLAALIPASLLGRAVAMANNKYCGAICGRGNLHKDVKLFLAPLMGSVATMLTLTLWNNIVDGRPLLTRGRLAFTIAVTTGVIKGAAATLARRQMAGRRVHWTVTETVCGITSGVTHALVLAFFHVYMGSGIEAFTAKMPRNMLVFAFGQIVNYNSFAFANRVLGHPACPRLSHLYSYVLSTMAGAGVILAAAQGPSPRTALFYISAVVAGVCSFVAEALRTYLLRNINRSIKNGVVANTMASVLAKVIVNSIGAAVFYTTAHGWALPTGHYVVAAAAAAAASGALSGLAGLVPELDKNDYVMMAACDAVSGAVLAYLQHDNIAVHTVAGIVSGLTAQVLIDKVFR